MRRVIGAVQIEHDVGGHSVPLLFAQVQLAQGQRHAVAALAIDGVLQPRQGRLAGQIMPRLGQAAADQFQERIGAQHVRVVLILVAAGDLEDVLADQRLPAAAHRTPPPLRNRDGQGRAQPQGHLGLLQPGQPPIGGQAPAVETGFQRHGGNTAKAKDGCGRLAHAGASWFGFDSTPHPYQRGAPLSPPPLMNHPG
jgi:hypothetical protein